MSSMHDFMRGDAKPRYKLDVAQLEQRLGAPLGSLLTELSKLACKREPFAPWTAFEGMQMLLVYLVAEPTPDHEANSAIPDNGLTFLETGVDLNCAGFIDDGSGRPLDQRQVWMVRDGESRIVAPDLAAYLGLVAIAGAEAVDLERSDEDWLEEREERLQEDEFRALSKELCSLPGVKLARVAKRKGIRSWFRKATTVNIDDEPRETGLARVRQLVRGGRQRPATTELVKQIGICVSVGDMIPAERWREIDELVGLLKPSLPADIRAELTKRGVRL